MKSGAALREYYIDTIQRNGFVSVESSMSPSDIDPLFSSFRGVLSQLYDRQGQPTTHGQKVFEAFDVPDLSRPKEGGGFIRRQRVGLFNPYAPHTTAPTTENKDILHYTSQTREHVYQPWGTRSQVPMDIRELADRCEEIQQATRAAVRPVFKALGLLGVVAADDLDQVLDVLRVAHYPSSIDESLPKTVHGKLAEEHVDRSAFTVAIWESKPGLFGGPANNIVGDPTLTIEIFDEMAAIARANPIQHSAGLAKLFPGGGYNHLPATARRDSGNLPVLLHGVNDEQPGEERDSVINFIHSNKGLPYPVAGSEETTFELIRRAIIAANSDAGAVGDAVA